jgi:hypothetical protein
MIKYNMVVCRYDKILVNVAVYIIPGYVYVVHWLGVNFQFLFAPEQHTTYI